jgi:light-regulated signal transduction histidine kinase (bacteriophytochrome)
MEIIFHNLVHNGIHHNNKLTKKIELGYVEEGSAGYFYVKDNGPGLTGVMREKIAVKTSALPAQTVDPEGAGLGLYLVKRLLERYHGELRCETELGVGTTMFFPVL